MANQTIMNAICTCAMGTAPATLQVSSQATVTVCAQLAATIQDNVFPTFGMCNNTANPAVAAATAAKAGVFTPAPCTPAIAAVWATGSPTVNIGGKPALNSTSKLMCSYPGGVIQITSPGGMTVNIP